MVGESATESLAPESARDYFQQQYSEADGINALHASMKQPFTIGPLFTAIGTANLRRRQNRKFNVNDLLWMQH